MTATERLAAKARADKLRNELASARFAVEAQEAAESGGEDGR